MKQDERQSPGTRALAACAAFAVAAFAAPAPVAAQEIRFAEQFGLLYLPMQVVIHEKLIEKHAAKAGLKGVSAQMIKLSGGAAVNQALLSGNVEFASGGVGPLLTIWDRTHGTEDHVKAAIDLSKMPLKLVTNDPAVQKFEDYLKVSDHKIATPSISSIQAVTLRMASAKAWGDSKKLDSLLVNMNHPTAVAATLSGGQTVKSHFSTLPFSYQQLQSGKVRLILNSFDVLGGQHSIVSLYGTTKWVKANPKLYKVVLDAYDEAFKFIEADIARAAKVYVDFTKSKISVEDVQKMISSKAEMEYGPAPKNTMPFAKFMHQEGAIKNLPSSWKDYFHESAHGLKGS
ncbi:MAG TPA: ABC transporter substrate-binding protein [Burkholderiales bacterium]|nr:ABC transporter substrate-binding protein [Burkholderiales bacterium]